MFGSGELVGRDSTGGPADSEGRKAGIGEGIEGDILDEAADEAFAIGLSGGRGGPESGEVLSEGADGSLIGGRDREELGGLSGGEVIFEEMEVLEF